MRPAAAALAALCLAAAALCAAARCPSLPPVPPDLPAEFCSPAGGWSPVLGTHPQEALPGFLLEPAILATLQQELNATGWAPRPRGQLAVSLQGCQRAVCGWYFWLRFNLTCLYNQGQAAAELMLNIPSSHSSGDAPIVTVLSLELLQEGNEAMDNDEEEAAEKNAQLEGPPGTMPASVARVATVAPGQTPAAEFCSKAQGWEAVPDFEGVPGFLIDPGVLEGLQGANPVPCLHQDRTLAACGCSLAAPAGARYWLLANVSCSQHLLTSASWGKLRSAASWRSSRRRWRRAAPAGWSTMCTTWWAPSTWRPPCLGSARPTWMQYGVGRTARRWRSCAPGRIGARKRPAAGRGAPESSESAPTATTALKMPPTCCSPAPFTPRCASTFLTCLLSPILPTASSARNRAASPPLLPPVTSAG